MSYSQQSWYGSGLDSGAGPATGPHVGSLPQAIAVPISNKGSLSQESHTMGRSFVYSSFKPDAFLETPIPAVHSSNSVHEDTANLAEVGVDVDAEEEGQVMDDAGVAAPAATTEFDGARKSQLESYSLRQSYDTYGSTRNTANTDSVAPSVAETDLEALRQSPKRISLLNWIRSIPPAGDTATQFAKYTPAVFLGTLLNILDALSYGMIMFPLSEAVFSGMASTGLSMFYVSTIVSQLVYSCGGSAFKSGIGSEMIEVTPFFHQMAISIMNSMGEDNQAGIIATTMVTFAFSSVITGLCFGLLGKFRLGKLVGFFPRHILVGCVGGVGYFLVVTAIEVCSRIDGGLEYNWPTLQYLLQPLVFLQWMIPLILTVILVVAENHIHSPLLVPGYIVVVFVGFHLIVAAVPGWNLDLARLYGWVFPAQSSQEPWYHFYTLYDFAKVDWWLVFGEFPTILALTFFGVLHVPINVPALALSTGVDNVDVDRELLAHGVSNALSGLVGAIQNYLVYTNSVLFIRAGADSRMSGVMLAMATTGVMFAGPGIIGYIPVCVVGTLVFLLGYELLKEALWDTWGRLRPFEYVTVVVIVVTMGAVDFVAGILVGILLACLSFVVDAGSREVVSGIYTGEYARSIVIRHPKQLDFLEKVGRQTCVFKLTGSLFFGSIGGLEEKVRARFDQQQWQKEPIKYLIIDMKSVPGVDFSATEGFRRIRNVVVSKDCYLLISSVDDDSAIVRALEDCGLWETAEHRQKVQLFNNLNSALEWCENQFLAEVTSIARQVKAIARPRGASRLNSGSARLPLTLLEGTSFSPSDTLIASYLGSPRNLMQLSASPRQSQILSAAQKSLASERQEQPAVLSTNKQPLPLVLKVMQGLSDTLDDTFWAKLCPYLHKYTPAKGQVIYDRNNPTPALFFVERGLVDYEIAFSNIQFSLNSSVLPLTMFGDMVKAASDRRLIYTAASDSTVLWTLDMDSINRLQQENTALYEQLLAVCLRLASRRHDIITANLIVTS